MTKHKQMKSAQAFKLAERYSRRFKRAVLVVRGVLGYHVWRNWSTTGCGGILVLGNGRHEKPGSV